VIAQVGNSEDMNSVKQAIDTLEVLASPVSNGYGRQPIPTELDDMVGELVAFYMHSDLVIRREICAQITARLTGAFVVYAERMAAQAVRMGAPDLLELGMVALMMTQNAPDRRDVILVLPLFVHSCKIMNVDASKLFADVSQYSTGLIGAHFSSFLKRTEEDQSLAAMGYEVGQDEGGFRYRRTW
jgi:hypothetical protein